MSNLYDVTLGDVAELRRTIEVLEKRIAALEETMKPKSIVGRRVQDCLEFVAKVRNNGNAY